MEKKGHKLIDIISPFVIALIFSPWLIFLYLYLSNYSLKLDINDQEFIKGFIEWFGTAYGLFLALVLVNVWEQFGTVEREFDREVDALSMLLQTI
jgi:ABC-type sugar transport system permease subunit